MRERFDLIKKEADRLGLLINTNALLVAVSTVGINQIWAWPIIIFSIIGIAVFCPTADKF